MVFERRRGLLAAAAMIAVAGCGSGAEGESAVPSGVTSAPAQHAAFAIPASMKDAICSQTATASDVLTELDAASTASQPAGTDIANRLGQNVSAFKRLADDVERTGDSFDAQVLRTHLNRLSSNFAVFAIEFRSPPADAERLEELRTLLAALEPSC